MEKTRLLSLIKEVFKAIFKEAEDTEHSEERLEDRIGKIGITSELEMKIIKENLDIIRNCKFRRKYSFALMLVKLNVDKNSHYAVEIGGKYYYKVPNGVFQDSVGNEIWAIIRDDEIRTLMLRQDNQQESKLLVDFVIRMPKKASLEDFKKYLEKVISKPKF